MKTRTDVTVLEGYRRWAPAYDSYANPLIAVEEERVRRLVGDVKGARVLDAGCGTGRHTAWLCAAGARVVGVDENAAMLARARERCPGAELHEGALEALDTLALGRFEVVLNALVAEHLADVDALFARLARRLEPDGRLVFSVWHPFMILKGVLTHFEDASAGVEFVLPTHAHLVSDYYRALRAAGLELDALEEACADEALVRRMPHMQKHLGMPLALLLRARARAAA